MNISSLESYIDLLEKTAKIFKQPNLCVKLGYEAPWSAKIGNKKSVAYISNDEDLEELWTEYNGYLKEQATKKKTKKKKKAEEVEMTSGIVFRNMWDSMNVQVSDIY